MCGIIGINSYKPVSSAIINSLKKFLIGNGHKFKSQTDTDVIVHLITEHLKKDNIINSIKKTLKLLHGSFALGIILSLIHI